MEMRPLVAGDAGALHALDQRCFPPGIAYSMAEIRGALAAAGGFHRGYAGEDGIAAFILTVPARRAGARAGPKWGHIITVDVDPNHRRAGFGRSLMLAAEAHYAALGAPGLRLEVAVNNAPALAFYAGLGFRVVKPLPGYYAGDVDGLQMEKSLA